MSMVGFKAKNHPQQNAKRGEARDEVDDRGTKREYIDELEARFGAPFTLDAAAAPHNAKAATFYTRTDDGLVQPWSGRVWCNPPYSRTKGVMDLGTWVRKAWAEWERGECERIVMLLPNNRVEQGWWQDHIEPFRDRAGSPLTVEFHRSRMRFDQPPGWVAPPKGDRPPFGTCLAIWDRTSPPAPTRAGDAL